MILSVLIPVYNEEKTIKQILDKVVSSEIQGISSKEIIIVDDASTDNSLNLIENYIEQNHTLASFKLLKLNRNSGKGTALREAIRQVTGQFVIIQDADLEYEPGEYQSILEPIIKGQVNVVYGSRLTGAKPCKSMSTAHFWGNQLITFVATCFANKHLTDIETCYKDFEASALKDLKLEEKRFGIDPEITMKIMKIPYLKIAEVPISYYARTAAEGKKITWKDGVRAIYCIIKYSIFT